MKVARAHLTRIRVPLTGTFVSSQNRRTHLERTVIRLETDDGLLGIGETAGSPEVFALAQRLAGGLIGSNPLQRNELRQVYGTRQFQNMNGRNGWIALGGIEMACWDIAGKHHELPLYDMLGGAERRSIPAVCEMGGGPFPLDVTRDETEGFFAEPGNVDKVVEHARRTVKRDGYRYLKLKCPGGNPDWDVRVMTALREALGSAIHLRHDPNAAYTTGEALGICRRLDSLDLQWFEDPATGLDGLRRVRSQVRTAVATNMSVVQFDHLAAAIRLGAVDVVGVDQFHWGGIASAREVAAVCQAFGLGVFLHSFFELGVATAANLHMAAAFPGMTNGMDTCLYIQDDDIIRGGGFKVADGHLSVPDGPGLAVDLDEEAIARATLETFEAEA